MPPLSDTKTESVNNARIVRVRDLPIYYHIKNDDPYRYVLQTEDDQLKTNNNWLYPYISQMRQSVQKTWNDNKELRLRIIRSIETGEAHSKAAIDYIHDDQTFFPKVGVVTIAGLGGLLLGHKGGPVRKTFYSSVAALVALSTCYPKQSANILDQVYIRIKNESKSLLDGGNKSSLPVVLQNKDRILHATKTTNESITTAKGDYGQGTPSDQQFYTTRSSTS